MTETTNIIAETTISKEINDVFSETLGFLKISGSLLLNEVYSLPWAISVPDKNELAETLKKNNVHIAAFHLVQRGYIEIELENGNKELVREGEMVICFGGNEHIVFQGESRPAQSFKDIMQGVPNIFEPIEDNYAQSTSLICGIFIMHDTILNPLFEALPPLLKISPGEDNHYSSSTTAHIINLLFKEISQQSFAHNYMIERYLELLCAKSIHSYVETASSGESGWLYAIKDPKIAQVISAIHKQPAYLWSVKELAKLVSLSPSRFAARFTEIMGASPMIYVTRWRMYLASKLLNDTRLGLDLISNQVGYDNVAAFSRAFKRNIGSAPGVWRTDNRAKT